MKHQPKWLALVVFMVAVLVSSSAFAMSAYIPGAHSVNFEKQDDLTTNNPANYSAADEKTRASLAPSEFTATGEAVRPAYYTPAVKVPGYTITGYFEDAHFVVRIPEKWNGKLVVAGMPGLRNEKSCDTTFSDYVLSKFDKDGNSYAYASIDKGTAGEMVPNAKNKIMPYNNAQNALWYTQPGNFNDSVAEWNIRLHQLTVGTKTLLEKFKGKAPSRTYLMGHSNGGYVVRYALEHDGALYDGGIDWEGMLWNSEKSNMLQNLHAMYKNYLVYTSKTATPEQKQAAYSELLKYLPEGAEFIWPVYAPFYWYSTFDIFAQHFDPTYRQNVTWDMLALPPYWKQWENWDYNQRPAAVKDAIRQIENNGNLQKPMISIFGTLDSLCSVKTAALPYQELVEQNQKGNIYRLYLVKNGNHLDGWVGSKYDPNRDNPEKALQPLLPYVHQSFDILVDWVENGNVAPSNKTIGIPAESGKVLDIRSDDTIMPY